MKIAARPEPVEWDPRETAVVVVDMQNGFLKPGGYFDRVGYELSHARRIIEQVVVIVAATRAGGLAPVFLQSGFDRHHAVVGGPSAPVWHKSEAQILMRERPELAFSLITEGGWDYAIVDELKPRPGELVVHKSRYSGFAGTNLDQVLRARRVRNLVFCGVAANVCVETTLRDAYGHEYFVLLLEDATAPAGPPELLTATLFNVERFFGWVATTAAFLAAVAPAHAPADAD
jgi:ureidoacrylate peracid hydrolase